MQYTHMLHMQKRSAVHAVGWDSLSTDARTLHALDSRRLMPSVSRYKNHVSVCGYSLSLSAGEDLSNWAFNTFKLTLSSKY